MLASRPAFADEPDLVAWHALHTIIEHTVLMAIRNTDTASRKETCQPTFGALPPADPSPRLSGQQRFCSDRGLIRHVVFAGLSGPRDGKDQCNVGRIDILASRQSHRPGMPSFMLKASTIRVIPETISATPSIRVRTAAASSGFSKVTKPAMM